MSVVGSAAPFDLNRGHNAAMPNARSAPPAWGCSEPVSRSGRAALAFVGVGLSCLVAGLVAASAARNDTVITFGYVGGIGASSVLGFLAFWIGTRAQPKTLAAKWGMALGLIAFGAWLWVPLYLIVAMCASGSGGCT